MTHPLNTDYQNLQNPLGKVVCDHCGVTATVADSGKGYWESFYNEHRKLVKLLCPGCTDDYAVQVREDKLRSDVYDLLWGYGTRRVDYTQDESIRHPPDTWDTVDEIVKLVRKAPRPKKKKIVTE